MAGSSIAAVERAGPVRRLPLQGAVNFRDLGGYPVANGRRVRWGRLFRSDQLADLSEADLAQLADLGLRAICDLRGESERVHRPNRVLRDSVQVHAIGFMPYRGDELLADAKAGSISVGEIENRVGEIYRRFVTEQVAAFSQLLKLILDDELPLLFHCTSGRDRTGFASAVILMALGASRSVIEQDYALSNQYRRDLTFQIGGEVDVSVMSALTQAHPDYLAAAFKAIDETWGSDTAYLRQALGLSESGQRELQALLLEPIA